MPRIGKVYTRTGDDGTTGLGGGQRVRKDAPRIEAYGAVDELNATVGVALAGGLAPQLDEALKKIQNELFHLGSDLCFLEEDKQKLAVPRHRATPRRRPGDADRPAQRGAGAAGELHPARRQPWSGGLHVARTVCRRAERLLVGLAGEEAVGEWTVRYLNRLSDALFVMARYENHERGIGDVLWDSRA